MTTVADAPFNWAMIGVTALASIVVSVITAWLVFVLVTKRQMIAADQMRRKQEKSDRIREEVHRWSNPILGSVRDLRGRLDNILRSGGHVALASEYQPPRNWSISHDYFIRSSLYMFGVYFAYAGAMRDSLSFELFETQQEKEQLLNGLKNVGSALSEFPAPDGCSGKDVQVFHLEQRAMGALLLLEDGRRCISYPEFIDKLEEPRFARAFQPLRDLLVGARPQSDCRWRRLERVNVTLVELDDICKSLLNIR
ncbi:hypothetical protein ABZT47_22830 [Sphaerisporangium sp. NPDC005289]|uniref:hypothetical protein n=1 Tax=Sphaerisporangium sp. NPDC005289 TaxID=3155247 RepID=UPI0033AEA2BE